MEDLSLNLSAIQKTQLHEVANLMLGIYHTLARMRYLSPSWIHPGPHDTSSLLALYRSHELSPAVVCLYSILPYVDAGGAEEVKFLQGGRFVDFRTRGDVERGRDPFYGGEEAGMKPWMTPLSALGNHGSVMVYCTRRHRIWILDQETGKSTDHGLLGGSAVGVRETENQDGDEDGGGEEDGAFYDIRASRPAGDVLRDTIQWYQELIETPGGDEHTGEEVWDSEVVRPLYIKHSWPNADFEGDAFLTDKARTTAAELAKYSAEQLVEQVHLLKEKLANEEDLALRRDKLAAASTDDEQWLARWDIWQTEHILSPRTLVELKRAEAARDKVISNGQSQSTEELLLAETRQLRESCRARKDRLEALQQATTEMEAGKRKIIPGMQMRISHAEEQVTVYQKAYEAARLDADRLFDEGYHRVVADIENMALDPIAKLKVSIEEMNRAAEESQLEVTLIRKWIAQVPDTATQARQEAHDEAERKEQYIEWCVGQSRGMAAWLAKEQEKVV